MQEVEAGGGVEVGVARQLAGEERLAETTAEQAAHRAVAQVQLPGDSLAEGKHADSRSISWLQGLHFSQRYRGPYKLTF